MILDGVGLMGHDDHTPGETADLRTLPSQTKRAAVTLYRLSAATALIRGALLRRWFCLPRRTASAVPGAPLKRCAPGYASRHWLHALLLATGCASWPLVAHRFSVRSPRGSTAAVQLHELRALAAAIDRLDEDSNTYSRPQPAASVRLSVARDGRGIVQHEVDDLAGLVPHAQVVRGGVDDRTAKLPFRVQVLPRPDARSRRPRARPRRRAPWQGVSRS